MINDKVTARTIAMFVAAGMEYVHTKYQSHLQDGRTQPYTHFMAQQWDQRHGSPDDVAIARSQLD